MSSINTYPTEVTPLVRSISESRNVPEPVSYANRVLLSCFLAVLMVGTFCGIYLLSVEGETYRRIERFDFVTQKEWGVNISQLDTNSSNIPFTKVLFINLEEFINPNCSTKFETHINKNENVSSTSNETRIKNCGNENILELNTDTRHYSKNVEKHYGIKEIWYNFYVNAEGTIFEGRGFYLMPFCDACSNVLTIGCKGIQESKTTNLALKIKAFLDYSISKRVLNHCFEILVEESSNSRKLADISYWINKWNKKMRISKNC